MVLGGWCTNDLHFISIVPPPKSPPISLPLFQEHAKSFKEIPNKSICTEFCSRIAPWGRESYCIFRVGALDKAGVLFLSSLICLFWGCKTWGYFRTDGGCQFPVLVGVINTHNRGLIRGSLKRAESMFQEEKGKIVCVRGKSSLLLRVTPYYPA